MCGGFTCSKNALIALNVLYVVVASILISVAVYGQASSLVVPNLPIVGGILACGVFLILISILGLAGAVKHHQVMLFFYMVILFLLFLVQFSVACACLAVNSNQQELLAEQGWNTVDMNVKQQVQDRFNCCGFQSRVHHNTTDDFPQCGNVDTICCGNEPITPKCWCKPCMNMLKKTIDYAFKLCGGIGLFFSFTELFAVWLARRYRNQPDPNYKEPHAIFPRENYLY